MLICFNPDSGPEQKNMAFPPCFCDFEDREVSEQNELRTEEWKKRQALLRASGMANGIAGLTDLEGDVALFQDLLRYAKLADVAYAADEERGLVIGLERSRHEDAGIGYVNLGNTHMYKMN